MLCGQGRAQPEPSEGEQARASSARSGAAEDESSIVVRCSPQKACCELIDSVQVCPRACAHFGAGSGALRLTCMRRLCCKRRTPLRHFRCFCGHNRMHGWHIDSSKASCVLQLLLNTAEAAILVMLDIYRSLERFSAGSRHHDVSGRWAVCKIKAYASKTQSRACQYLANQPLSASQVIVNSLSSDEKITTSGSGSHIVYVCPSTTAGLPRRAC